MTGLLLADTVLGLDPTGTRVLAIALALTGAVLLAFATHLQHRGVQAVDRAHPHGSSGMSVAALTRLPRQPLWLGGTLLMGLAIGMHLLALSMAPIVVVQPLGILAIVVTVLISAVVTGRGLAGPVVRAVALCVAGVGGLVAVSALGATENEITDLQLVVILVILAAVALVIGVVLAVARTRFGSLFYVVAGGTLYGFVAALAKTVMGRVFASGVDWLAVGALAALVGAVVFGMYLIQIAYAVGTPDVVIAGLAVIDPLVAMVIGVIVLGEAAELPWWAWVLWLASAGVSTLGVALLARHHALAEPDDVLDQTDPASVS